MSEEIIRKIFKKQVVWTILLGILMFGVSQYYPLWGGILTIGEPFSGARMTLAFSHTIVGVIIGFFIDVYQIKKTL